MGNQSHPVELASSRKRVLRRGGATHPTKRRQSDGKPGHRASKVFSRWEPSLLRQAGAASARRKGLACRSHRGPRPRRTVTRVPQEPGRSAVSCVALLSVRVSPNQKAPGPPEVRLLPEGAKDKTRRGYCPANAMSQRDGRQKSECPHSTSTAGEPTQGSPSRGRRAPGHRPSEGNTVRASNLDTCQRNDDG